MCLCPFAELDHIRRYLLLIRFYLFSERLHISFHIKNVNQIGLTVHHLETISWTLPQNFTEDSSIDKFQHHSERRNLLYTKKTHINYTEIVFAVQDEIFYCPFS